MEEEKKLFYPVVFSDEENLDKEIQEFSKQKTFEERIYLLLYKNNEGYNCFEEYTGRSAFFKGLQDVLLREDGIDPVDIDVLCEIPGKDISGNTRWFLMGPNDPKMKNALMVYLSLQKQFPETEDFDIWDYTRITKEDLDLSELSEIPQLDVSAANMKIEPQLFGGEASVANEYAAFMEGIDVYKKSEVNHSDDKADLFKMPTGGQNLFPIPNRDNIV